MIKIKVLLFPIILILSASSNAGLCEELFTYSSAQVMNTVDTKKARLISQFELDSDASVEGTLKKQILSALSEYDEYSENDLERALADTDDGSAMITIAQSKKTKRLYTIVQFFLGDTEVGNIFSLYSSKKLAELGDGDCR